jgi:hypothetical protein
MPIADSRLLFVHIPKCGGTSVEVAIRVADDYPDIGLSPTVTKPNFDTLFGGGLQHLSIREIINNYPNKFRGKDIFKFAIIRDCVDRFLSYFLWKHFRFSNINLVSNDVMSLFFSDLKELVSLSHTNDLFKYPYDGLLYCEDDRFSVPLNDIIRHLLPQCCFLYNLGSITLDQVFLIDDMPRVGDMLTHRFDFKNPIPLRMVGSMRKKLRCRISEDVEFLIRSVYRHDQKLVEAIRDGKDQNAQVTPLGSPDFPKIPSLRRARLEPTNRIPRTLWIFWDQGLENAPTIVKNCIQSWLLKNRSWDIHVLSQKTVGEVISLPEWYSTNLNLPLPAYSDVLRIHLLQRYGGVWADATTWCARPLDDWIDQITRSSGFFAYAKPSPDRPLASWFLAATEHNFIVERWAAQVDAMWQNSAGTSTNGELADEPNSLGYFWFHKLFASLIDSEGEVAKAWNSVPQISADAPHYLQSIGLLEKATDEIRFHIVNKLTNVYKLSRRLRMPDDLGGTVMGLLFEELESLSD